MTLQFGGSLHCHPGTLVVGSGSSDVDLVVEASVKLESLVANGAQVVLMDDEIRAARTGSGIRCMVQLQMCRVPVSSPAL
ncbi:hypothetical protein ACH4UM_25610 [Streptomyces sp. NPDC020801]|uniref:hypothetical protein n=1 Tax=unclassified Streptomyces TaxID=2593676 RepID=UPI0037B23E32